jgi:hypothetical protein
MSTLMLFVLEHPISSLMRMDMPSNGTACLEHDDISYVELTRFAIGHDSHTNDIESFVLLFPFDVPVVQASVMGQAADETDSSLEQPQLQPSWLLLRAYVVDVAMATMDVAMTTTTTTNETNWVMPIVEQMLMLV